MSFEDSIFRKIDRSRERREELSPSMERAYAKAVQVLANPEYSIQESEFESVYGAGAIAADRALTTRLRSKFDMNQTLHRRMSKKMAGTLEAIMLEEGELSEWFGSNATTLKTSDFDDYVNKVDMVTEWHSPEGSRVLALAVDVTFGTASVADKFQDIRREIDAGKLGSMKYFKDTRGDFAGTRNNIPRTVIGVSQRTVEDLANLWVNGEKQKLGVHPAQRVFAIQMMAQLQAMEEYAVRKGQHDIARVYREARATIVPIEAEKRRIPLGSLIDDPVALEISKQTYAHFE